MAIKELFNDARPQVLFDPRASQRIDPRFKFTRDGVATYVDQSGIVRTAAKNQPRISHNPVTGQSLGLLIEKSRVNSLATQDFSDASYWDQLDVTTTASAITAPDGSASAYLIKENTSNAAHKIETVPNIATTGNAWCWSVFLKPAGRNFVALALAAEPGSVVIFDIANGVVETENTATGEIEEYPNGWYRCTLKEPSAGSSREVNVTLYSDASTSVYTGDGISGVHVWGGQLEIGTFPTSYIPTSGSAVTREPDLLTIEAPLPSTGSIYIDARSLTSDVDTTLLSAAPASPSTDKLALAIREPASLYDSKALVYEVDGAFKPTLPFPVPTNARERNLITYGANNYHYRSDSARYTPSSSTSVPTNMTRLGIGHDVTDSTKAMTGYINAVYLWPGEITPTVAEALVRGDVDPKDADAGVFTPAAGSLAFVFNTQGTAADGDTVVQLPLRGSTNNVLVDWGDNTSSSLIGSAASVTVNHTYPSAGIYPVQIEADDDGTNSGLSALEFYNNSPLDLVRVLQWGGTTTFQPTTMYRIFRDCTQLDFESGARTNLPDTSGCSDWREAFYNCSSLSGQYPNFDHSGATQLSYAWYGCSSITSFGSSLNDLNSAGNYVTNYSGTWEGCSSITSFPTITIPNDQGDVTLSSAWNGCSNLNSFPVGIDTSAVTNFQSAWRDCSSLASFPLINTSSGASFTGAWYGCSSLDNIANAGESTSFPLIDTSSGTNFSQTWRGCSSLTIFPSINTSLGDNFSGAWAECSSLTSFPLIDTSLGASFFFAWQNCSSLDNIANAGESTSFPLIDTSSGTNFSQAWLNCSSLTIFPSINTSLGTSFAAAWRSCSSLTDFPANFFDSWAATPANNCFVNAWDNCSSLTATSVENILNSIDTSGRSAPASGVDITINYNASSGTPNVSTAVTNLKNRGWTITLNGVAQ